MVGSVKNWNCCYFIQGRGEKGGGVGGGQGMFGSGGVLRKVCKGIELILGGPSI